MATKYTQQFDFTPFLRQNIPTANRGGAIADIFSAVANTADGYGENSDNELLGKLAKETDKSKIVNEAFYSPKNAITAIKKEDTPITDDDHINTLR